AAMSCDKPGSESFKTSGISRARLNIEHRSPTRPRLATLADTIEDVARNRDAARESAACTSSMIQWQDSSNVCAGRWVYQDWGTCTLSDPDCDPGRPPSVCPDNDWNECSDWSFGMSPNVEREGREGGIEASGDCIVDDCSGGHGCTFQCSMDPDGLDGPCRSFEQRSVERERQNYPAQFQSSVFAVPNTRVAQGTGGTHASARGPHCQIT